LDLANPSPLAVQEEIFYCFCEPDLENFIYFCSFGNPPKLLRLA
jgi:hypothetical protein